MNARAQVIEATETARIEAALDALLRVAVTATREPSLLGEEGPISARDACAEALEKMAWTPARREADRLLARPVAEAIRQAIRTLGKRLHEIGGHTLMLDVLDRVAELDPANAGRRTAIMDHRWDGIGDWHA